MSWLFAPGGQIIGASASGSFLPVNIQGGKKPGSPVHGDSPGKNTVVGYHALHQGIFPTQGENTGFPHCSQILYHLSLRKAQFPLGLTDFISLLVWQPQSEACNMSTKYFSKIKDGYILNIKRNVFGNEKDYRHTRTILWIHQKSYFYNILCILIDNISHFSRTTEVQGTRKEGCCFGNWR